MIANIVWKSNWHTFVSNMLQMPIFRYGQFSHLPVDTVFLRSLSCSFRESNIPKEGSMVEIVYNFATDKISSSLITICGPRCRPYKIERDLLVADKCYSIAAPKDFTVIFHQKYIYFNFFMKFVPRAIHTLLKIWR